VDRARQSTEETARQTCRFITSLLWGDVLYTQCPQDRRRDDQVGNRHNRKGVCSVIISRTATEKMPILADSNSTL